MYYGVYSKENNRQGELSDKNQMYKVISNIIFVIFVIIIILVIDLNEV